MSKKKAFKFPHFALKIPATLWAFLRGAVLGLMLLANIYFWGPWSSSSNVLGVASEQTSVEDSRDLTYWQSVVHEYPDYKDAHRMIAVLAFRLKNDELADVEARRVLELDPNDNVAGEILTTLSSAQAP